MRLPCGIGVVKATDHRRPPRGTGQERTSDRSGPTDAGSQDRAGPPDRAYRRMMSRDVVAECAIGCHRGASGSDVSVGSLTRLVRVFAAMRAVVGCGHVVVDLDERRLRVG